MTIFNPLNIQAIIEEKRQIYGMRLERFLMRLLNDVCQKINQAVSSHYFCLWSVAAIFLYSIFLRSTVDIGYNSGFILTITQDIAQGGRYYHNFFDDSLPLPFLVHLIAYHIAHISGVSVIIIADYLVNSLALMSLYYTHKILQKADFRSGQRNIITTACALGFFLRLDTLHYNEFLTHSSFYLMLAFPYIAYSFHRTKPLTRLDMFYRGTLAGLIPCLKLHYVILPLVIELCRFMRQRELTFFVEIDKLMMIAVSFFYALYMMFATSEFFIYMIPMHHIIDELLVHYDRLLTVAHHVLDKVILLAIFLIFLHHKLSKQDAILLQVLSAISLIMLCDNSYVDMDENVAFHGIAIMVVAKIFYDFLTDHIIDIKKHYFLFGALCAISLFDDGLHNIKTFLIYFWMITIPVFSFMIYRAIIKENLTQFTNKQRLFFLFIFLCFIALAAGGIYLSSVNNSYFIIASLFIFFSFLVSYERIYITFFKQKSALLLCTIFILCIGSISSYITNIHHPKTFLTSPNIYSETLMRYAKTYLQDPRDKMLFIMQDKADAYPFVNYMNITTDNTIITEPLFKNIDVDDSPLSLEQALSKNFTINYLLDNLKSALQDPHNKIIVINNMNINKEDRCVVSFLEYYLKDDAFKKRFFDNYQYVDNLHYSIADPNQSNIEFFAKNQVKDIDLEKTLLRYNSELYIRKERHAQ